MTNDEQRQWYATGCARTGYGVDPLPFFSDRARRHPVATLLQALPFTGAWHNVATKQYAAAQWPDESPMALSTQGAQTDPGITVHRWDVRHNVLACAKQVPPSFGRAAGDYDRRPMRAITSDRLTIPGGELSRTAEVGHRPSFAAAQAQGNRIDVPSTVGNASRRRLRITGRLTVSGGPGEECWRAVRCGDGGEVAQPDLADYNRRERRLNLAR